MTTPTPYTIKVREILEHYEKDSKLLYIEGNLTDTEYIKARLKLQDQALQQLERLVLDEVIGEDVDVSKLSDRQLQRIEPQNELKAEQRAIITNGKE